MKIHYLFIGLIVLYVKIFPQGFEEALEKARSQNKKVVVKIFTDWCGWCKKMDKDVYRDEKVEKILDDAFIVTGLNAEGSKEIEYNGNKYTEAELSSYFGAAAYPTTVFLESDGKLIVFKYGEQKLINIPGYINASEFRKLLKFVSKEKYKNKDLSDIF
ncbi:MAG: DUF255 domain-containing protein [Ignavibacteria bacterium]|nr:DUF255 domain-containing protein [Ignavibacteria bacterium]